MLHLALQRLISYRFVHISLHTGCLPLQKTDIENCNSYPCVQTDSGRFAFLFLWSTGQVSGELVTCAKTLQRTWTKTVI